MTPDEMKELRELVEFLKENGLNEFEFERGDLKIRLKFVQPMQAAPASALDLARLGQLLSRVGTRRLPPHRESTPWLPRLRRLLLRKQRKPRQQTRNCIL
jgi:hypothetical protein